MTVEAADAFWREFGRLVDKSIEARAFGEKTRVHFNPAMDPDHAYLIDMNALEISSRLEDFLTEPPIFDQREFRSHLRLSMGIDFGRTQVEQDPFWQKPPQSFRAGMRWIASVIGYDWRKLRGKLRRYPKSVTLITGLEV